MIQTNTPCRHCQEPMIGIDLGRHFRIVCNKPTCPLFRERQGVIEKQIELAPIETFMPAPLPRTPSPRRRRLLSGKKARKKTVRRKGLVYARKTV
jgi:hypothetical protein